MRWGYAFSLGTDSASAMYVHTTSGEYAIKAQGANWTTATLCANDIAIKGEIGTGNAVYGTNTLGEAIKGVTANGTGVAGVAGYSGIGVSGYSPGKIGMLGGVYYGGAAIVGLADIQETNIDNYISTNMPSGEYSGLFARGNFAIYSSSIQSLQTISPDFFVSHNGYVGIGTSTIPADYKLAVAGKMITEGVTIKLKSDWPDYVFDKSYKLMSIPDLKNYVEENKHLPDMKPAQQVKDDGMDVEETQAKLVQKVEELTLYMIRQQEKIDHLEKELLDLKASKQ